MQEKHPFTQLGLEALGPSLSGVYGIFGDKVCIYIGAANDMKVSLMEQFGHTASNAELIWEHAPIYYQAGIRSSNGIPRVLAELTEEYQPVVK